MRGSRCCFPLRIAGAAVMACLVLGCGKSAAPPETPPAAVSVRCAVIGGLADTGLWEALGERFQAETGHTLELVARGPKQVLIQEFVDRRAHVIAMHNCDAVINLVADGLAVNPQPWARNDFVLVGPSSDPAKVRGMNDAREALRQIIESKSKLLLHASHGAMEVMHDLIESEGLTLDAEQTLMRPDDRHRQMLLFAGQQNAYTLVGRIPFLSGKLPKQDLEIMVQGDPRLRRPYVVATAAGDRTISPELRAADQFAAFLRQASTQAAIAEYGRGQFDDRPLFYAITVPAD